MSASDVMKSQIKLLAKKALNSALLEYLLNNKDMKESVSSMDVIITSSTKEIIRQIKCQMNFLIKLVLKKNLIRS